MANLTMLAKGGCPPPFLEASEYPNEGGFISGRFCAPLPFGAKETTCCLPCPQTDWVYGDDFWMLTQVANYINVAGMACCIFLLVSFAALPVKDTHRHYLSVCLILGIMLMQMGFIVPLIARPEECYNDITPNDMFSSLTCAFSGAFLLAGGWCGVMWVFLRALSLHLQICWQVNTGRKFFCCAQIAGWGIPAIFVAISLCVTGVSFRFGATCHINHRNALEDFWGPLLAFTGAAIIVQFATFGYCIKVYLQSLMEDGSSSGQTSSLPSYTSSVRTATARQAYKRVQRVIALQWRGIAVVLLIIADVVFFSVVFVYMDSASQAAMKDPSKAQPWLACLFWSGGDKNKCLDEAESLVLNEPTVMAVLILLSMNGIWCLFFLGRWSMVRGWIELVQKRVFRKREFVSVDARRFSNTPRAYEMLKSPSQTPAQTIQSPTVMESPSEPPPMASSPLKGSGTKDYFGQEARYTSPHLSFSTPRPPSASAGREWDPAATHAKSSVMPGFDSTNKI